LLSAAGKFSAKRLTPAAQVVDLPLLFKDFIVSSCKLYQACAFGADAVLVGKSLMCQRFARRPGAFDQRLRGASSDRAGPIKSPAVGAGLKKPMVGSIVGLPQQPALRPCGSKTPPPAVR